MREFAPDFNRNEDNEKPLEQARVEVIGTENPAVLSREEFEQKAWLFHGSRESDFKVRPYDYENEWADDVTLGPGLYATDNKELADGYSKHEGSAWKLMPYKATVLNLTNDEKFKNLAVPEDLAREFTSRLRIKMVEGISDPESKWGWLWKHAPSRLTDLWDKWSILEARSFQGADLRGDVLGTGSAPFSMVGEEWANYLQSKGIDGLVYWEGKGVTDYEGEDARTFIFYSPEVVGTYEDWQERSGAESAE